MRKSFAIAVFLLAGLVSIGADAQEEELEVDVRVDDAQDRRLTLAVLPLSFYVGRGVSLGISGVMDFAILSNLRLHAAGYAPYVAFGDLGVPQYQAEAALAIVSNTVVTTTEVFESTVENDPPDPPSVPRRVIRGVELPIKMRTNGGARAGVRIYDGPTHPAAPSDRTRDGKRVPTQMLTTFVGVTWFVRQNFYARVGKPPEHRRSRTFGNLSLDLLYTPIADVDAETDRWTFPLGFRFTAWTAPPSSWGGASRFEFGLNGRGAGWYLLWAIGLGGSAWPFGGSD